VSSVSTPVAHRGKLHSSTVPGPAFEPVRDHEFPASSPQTPHELAPGRYVIEAFPEGVDTAEPVDVTVVAGEFAETIVAVDSGMRDPSARATPGAARPASSERR